MTPAAVDVWNEIREAFPPALPAQPVTACDCDECRQVQADLGHLRWTEVLPPAVDREFGALSLLTGEAFQALLPAYLFHALADLRNENKILEWTLYTLCGAYDEEEEGNRLRSDEYVRRRNRSFTPAQRAAVRRFLELAATVPDLEWHRYPIRHAVSTLWR